MKPPPEDADSLDKNGDDTRRDRFIGDRDLTTWRSRLGRQLARVTRWLGPYATLITTLVIGMVAVVALTAIAAEIYEAVTESDGVAGLDKPLLAAAISIRTPWLDTAATALTDVAGVIGMPIIAVLAIIILTIRRHSWTPALLITAAGIGSLLMTIAGKNLIGRARPDLTDAVPPYEHSPSFPSGHALNAVVIAGIIAYLLILRQQRLTTRIITITIAATFAVAIGATRVYLGHHWFTDVLAAYFLGAGWLALVITAHRLYLTARVRKSLQAEPSKSSLQETGSEPKPDA